MRLRKGWAEGVIEFSRVLPLVCRYMRLRGVGGWGVLVVASVEGVHRLPHMSTSKPVWTYMTGVPWHRFIVSRRACHLFAVVLTLVCLTGPAIG